MRDWFALLSGGRRVVAVGSSDSHELVDTPVGYPRTCLELGTDEDGEDCRGGLIGSQPVVVTGGGDRCPQHVLVQVDAA